MGKKYSGAEISVKPHVPTEGYISFITEGSAHLKHLKKYVINDSGKQEIVHLIRIAVVSLLRHLVFCVGMFPIQDGANSRI